MAGKTVAILGAGVGGLVAATQLRRRLPVEHRVVLIDKQDTHVFAPSFLWLMLGWREPRQIYRDLNVLGRKGIEFIHGQVERIDLANRRVETSRGQISYDYLITALGAELAPETVPGVQEGSFGYYDLAAATRFRDALDQFDGGTIAVAVASTPYKCPAAPYEGVLLMDYFFRRRGSRNRVELQLYTPEPAPMPVAGPALGRAVKEMLEQRDIQFHPTVKLASVDATEQKAHFENGDKVNYDLMVTIPPHRCPQVVRNAGLTGDDGAWVPVDRDTLETAHGGVYALGDITAIPLANGMMLPKAGVFAHGQGEVVARNIASEVRGRGPRKQFDGHGSCFLETGFGKAAMASGDFFGEPHPEIKLRRPARLWHGAKVLFEKWWLTRWF